MAFTSDLVLYQFARMPFGLKDAPATFRRGMDIILSSVKWKTALVLVDDILLFARSVEDHMEQFGQVLTLLDNAGLTPKLKECTFFAEKID